MALRKRELGSYSRSSAHSESPAAKIRGSFFSYVYSRWSHFYHQDLESQRLMYEGEIIALRDKVRASPLHGCLVFNYALFYVLASRPEPATDASSTRANQIEAITSDATLV